MADYKPYSFANLQANLPDVMKARRKAAALRESEAGFKEQGAREGAGNFTPTQSSGSSREAYFKPTARYMKDYSNIGDKIVGGIGEYTEGKKAGTAEGELDKLSGEGLLTSAQQYGEPGQLGGGKGLAAAGFEVPPSLGPTPGGGRGLEAAGFASAPGGLDVLGMSQPPPGGGKQGSPGGFGGGGKQGSPGGFGGGGGPVENDDPKAAALRAMMQRLGGP